MKINKLYVFVVFITCFILFIVIRESFKDVEVEISYQQKVLPCFLDGKEDYGDLRDVIYLNDSVYVSSYCELTGSNPYPSMKIWDIHKPIIDLDTTRVPLQLGDLKYPYTISKKANSDTLIVEKNKYILKFLMSKE